MKIAVHTLVRNEARFIWYSVMSVIRHVDRVRLWDTGSTDGTLEIIGEIFKTEEERKTRIFFKQVNVRPFNEMQVRQEMLDVDTAGDSKTMAFRHARQNMLEETTADWFIVVDGDEIWWEDSIKQLVDTIQKKGDELESIAVPFYNLVGDIYHYQEPAANRYKIAGKRGYTIRAINRKIPGLKSLGGHGVWGWADNDNRMIQERDSRKIAFLDAPFLHATHLPRAQSRKEELEVYKRPKKLKYEIGEPFPPDFYYPEVFFRQRPEIVPSPWVKLKGQDKLRALIQTPIKRIKRRLIKGSPGY